MTQLQKALAILIRDGGWIPTYEFQNRCGLFIGHRGPARISDLAIDYPEMVEVDKKEKTYKYRFKFDNVPLILQAYPRWRELIKAELTAAKRPFKQYKTVYEDTGEGTVRPRVILE